MQLPPDAEYDRNMSKSAENWARFAPPRFRRYFRGQFLPFAAPPGMILFNRSAFTFKAIPLYGVSRGALRCPSERVAASDRVRFAVTLRQFYKRSTRWLHFFFPFPSRRRRCV